MSFNPYTTLPSRGLNLSVVSGQSGAISVRGVTNLAGYKAYSTRQNPYIWLKKKPPKAETV